MPYEKAQINYQFSYITVNMFLAIFLYCIDINSLNNYRYKIKPTNNIINISSIPLIIGRSKFLG